MHVGLRLSVLLLLAVVVLTPFAGAATYEAWTDGLFDGDFDAEVLAALSLQSVIESAPSSSGDYVEVVVAVVSPGDDTAAHLTDPSPQHARAPPTAYLTPLRATSSRRIQPARGGPQRLLSLEGWQWP